MNLFGKIIDIVNHWATGPATRRWLVSPIVMLCFVAGNVAAVWGALLADNHLGLRVTEFKTLRQVFGWPMFVLGCLLMIWMVFLFFRQQGTPVPLNPPRNLITSGPYGVTRNPMISGWFISFFGLAIALGSVVLFLVVTPLMMLPFTLFIIKIEEPELEKRFGQEYANYKLRIPRFFPRFRPRRTARNS